MDAPGGQALSVDWQAEFTWLAGRLAQAGRRLPRRELARIMAAVGESPQPEEATRAVATLFRAQRLELGKWRSEPDEALLPMAVLLPEDGVAVVHGRAGDGAWLVEWRDGRTRVKTWPAGAGFLPIRAAKPEKKRIAAWTLFRQIFAEDRSWIVQSALASLLASVLALATALYSLQVYDRVIGQSGRSTLIVLSVGVGIAIAVELMVKLARMLIVERTTATIDHKLSHGVFARVMAVRLDQLSGDVGTLAAQVRGYETVRAFMSALTVYLLSDAPFALFFLVLIGLIAGPAVAAVPAVFLVLALIVGLRTRGRIEAAAATATAAGNRRQGLLVEAVAGLETLKAQATGWHMLGRWNDLSHRAIAEGAEIQRLNESATALAAALQQISYVGLVAAGAWVATSDGSLTVGSIIAASILSGRVLTPINQVSGLIVRWAHAKVALRMLEALFALERDNEDVDTPLAPEELRGNFAMRQVKFAYRGQPEPLAIPHLAIGAGEKLAVLGPIGSGKSTALRLLAGLVKPQEGRVLIDGMDIQHISRERLAETVGYLPQKAALFAGTLRDNLTAGLPLVGDGELMAAMQATGLQDFVATRREGVDLPISEGGGLSGGQQQLVAFTRLILARPGVWLLDEPTANMDDLTEMRCLAALRQAVRPRDTLVLVTHKVGMLGLVDRIVVIEPRGIILDGPRDEVLARLRKPRERVFGAVAGAAGGAA